MSFEQHCILELMGHARIAGKVSEEIAGTVFLRVDVPETNGLCAFTKFYSSSAVYSIIPVDEETCLRAVRAFQQRPIETWKLPNIQAPSAEQLEEETLASWDELDSDGNDGIDINAF